ncbi:MAG: molecular chaperone HtpG [Candidatus Aminicenantes bacterium]|jgi:molecular chaperone HtpG
MSKTKTEQFEFQSEVKQLLNILVYSLYKNKEVFLRELISNAVDALNKVHFLLLTDKNLPDSDLDLRIDISISKGQKKLTIEDTGIGMSKQELIDNIGTIARSGTVEFLKSLADADQKDRSELIGQFGVGFYSSFMVADEIHITTRSYSKDSRAWIWKSSGEKDYTIEETVKKNRGTRIELFLKKDEAKKFLGTDTLRAIIDKHSKFVPFPIYLEGEKIESTEAIWAQPKSSLKEKDYSGFFKFMEHTKDEPETYLHLSSDAPVQFNALLFVPKTSLEALGLFKEDPGIDLYSRKVLIQKGSRDILPEYMRFLKGVIDSEEIPLNISRETIQNDIKIGKIRKHVQKKFFTHLDKLKTKQRSTYLNIWKSFHRNLKEGVISDFDSRDWLAGLMLFHSSEEKKEDLIDLKTYVERMADGQKEIYYVTGPDIESLSHNPALEAFKEKKLEVLYLVDPLDEFVVEHLREFDGKPFKIAEGADIKLDKKADKAEDKVRTKKIMDFIAYLKSLYGNRITDVRRSDRLIDSPCLLVQAPGAPSVQMEKMMKLTNKDYQFSKRIFEINPENALIRELMRLHEENSDSEELKTLSLQLLENMMLREGILEDIDSVVPRLQNIMLWAAQKTDKTPFG